MNLHGKTVVVTGAANGLGAELARELHRRHCNLALIDIDVEGLQKAVAGMRDGNGKVTLHTADVSDEEAVISLKEAIIRAHKHVDILINNAAISYSLLFEQMDIADHRRLVDINFWGSVYVQNIFFLA